VTRRPNLDVFICYCVDRSDADVWRLLREQRWQELETLGVGHICTGCRADYRAIKALLKADVAAHQQEAT
jgi:bacterioferritin-associated ferredoxin